PWAHEGVPAARFGSRLAQQRIGRNRDLHSGNLMAPWYAFAPPSPYMRNEPLGAKHVVAVRLSKIRAQRAFLDTHPIPVADDSSGHDREQRGPVGHRNTGAEEHQQTA